MRNTTVVFTAILAMCTLVACQPTPKEEIVILKDSDRLIEIAQSNDADMDISEMIKAETNYSFETSSENGNVHIMADAEVRLPLAEQIPIVRVSRRRLTEQDVKKIFSALGEENTVVDDITFWKSYFQEDLDHLVSLRQQGTLDKYDSIDELDAAIASLIGKVQDAPDKPIAIDPDFSFHDNSEDLSEARILSTMDEFTLSDLQARNSETSITADYIRNVKERGLYHSQAMATRPYYAASLYCDPTQKVVPPTINEEEALRIANETVYSMGFSDMTCCGKRLAPIGDAQIGNVFNGAYEFLFTRTINSVNSTYTNDLYATPPDDPNSMAKPWGYEHIRIFIDDKGIAFLTINDPYQVEEVISKQSALLPFVDISAIFEHMIQTKYFSTNQDEKREICVQSVQLGHCRILEKGNSNYGLLVPAWDFMGTLTESSQRGSFTYGNDGYHCLLTINAIDGSIIDRSIGY